MPQFSANQQRTIEEIAERHRVSPDAVLTLLAALQAGGGRQVQFSHPELGGLGQWSQGGMIMVGDMFNNGLKATVDGLCNELSRLLENNPALDASIRLRLPYIEPLNLLQIELLKRHRAGETDPRIREGIQLSINAVATALRNSG